MIANPEIAQKITKNDIFSATTSSKVIMNSIILI